MQYLKIFSISFLFFLLVSSSEVSFGQGFHGGIMAGLAGSQVAGDTYSGYKKAGIFLGGFVGWDFTRRSALQLELEYFQKGSRKNPDPENNDYESYLFRANYVELPIFYQFKLGWFVLELGPSAGFLFGYSETQNGVDLTVEDGYNKPAPVTLQINAGFSFFFAEKMGFDFRTNNSLLNIRTGNRTGDVWRLWGYGQFHDALVLSIFYRFK